MALPYSLGTDEQVNPTGGTETMAHKHKWTFRKGDEVIMKPNIDTDRYETYEGKKPRGLGEYTFTVSFSVATYGNWSECKRAVLDVMQNLEKENFKEPLHPWIQGSMTAELDSF
jgi:hypothetical protein